MGDRERQTDYTREMVATATGRVDGTMCVIKAGNVHAPNGTARCRFVAGDGELTTGGIKAVWEYGSTPPYERAPALGK